MESVPHTDIECMVYLFRSLNKITILILNKQKTRKKRKNVGRKIKPKPERLKRENACKIETVHVNVTKKRKMRQLCNCVKDHLF